MVSLALFVFLFNLVGSLVLDAGGFVIDSVLWLLYLRLPTKTSQNAREQRRLKGEVVRLKRDMNNTSSQDEFAKWAKLKRRHDKATDDYDIISKQVMAQKASFDWTVKAIRNIIMLGGLSLLQFFYRGTPVFQLPPGWLPRYVEWVLSFPSAPLGSVSITVWNSACLAVVTYINNVVKVVMLGSQPGASKIAEKSRS